MCGTGEPAQPILASWDPTPPVLTQLPSSKACQDEVSLSGQQAHRGCTPPTLTFTKSTQILPSACQLAQELKAGLKLASDSFPFWVEGIELLQKANDLTGVRAAAGTAQSSLQAFPAGFFIIISSKPTYKRGWHAPQRLLGAAARHLDQLRGNEGGLWKCGSPGTAQGVNTHVMVSAQEQANVT